MTRWLVGFATVLSGASCAPLYGGQNCHSVTTETRLASLPELGPLAPALGVERGVVEPAHPIVAGAGRLDLRAVDMAGSGAVYWAAYHQNWAATALLVERGADWQSVHAANGEGLRQMVSQQLRRHPGDPALLRLERLLRAAS